MTVLCCRVLRAAASPGRSALPGSAAPLSPASARRAGDAPLDTGRVHTHPAPAPPNSRSARREATQLDNAGTQWLLAILQCNWKPYGSLLEALFFTFREKTLMGLADTMVESNGRLPVDTSACQPAIGRNPS